jgi:hypothetical protein
MNMSPVLVQVIFAVVVSAYEQLADLDDKLVKPGSGGHAPSSMSPAAGRLT